MYMLLNTHYIHLNDIEINEETHRFVDNVLLMHLPRSISGQINFHHRKPLQSTRKSMDTQLRNAYELGSASSDTAFCRKGATPDPPSSPNEFCLEKQLASDLAEAYTLKLTNRQSFQSARNSGMVEMPSNLAIRAGLLLFKNGSSEYLKHKEFLKNPSQYESSTGKVYCDAGNDIYARIVKKREQAISECIPTAAHVRAHLANGDLVQVVLNQYRISKEPESIQLLTHLEHVIEGALLDLHGDILESAQAPPDADPNQEN
jgi:hypothetical protein